MKKDQMISKQYSGIIKEVNADEKTITGYITTKDKDRQGEVVEPDGIKFDRYRKNPVVLWGHDYSTPAIGKNLWIKSDEKGLIAKTQFANTPLAQELFELYQGGFLNAFSIGFIPTKWVDGTNKDEASRTYIEAEMLEYSLCNIPANPEALMIARSKGILKSIEMAEMLNIDLDAIDKDIVNKPEPEVTENYVRIRIVDPAEFVDDSFRTIDISADEGIKAIIGKLKSDPEGPTQIQAYLFDNEKWTVEEAQAWVDEHKKEDKKEDEKSNSVEGLQKLVDTLMSENNTLKEQIQAFNHQAEGIVDGQSVQVEADLNVEAEKSIEIEKENPSGISAVEVKSAVDTLVEAMKPVIDDSIRREIRRVSGKVG